MKKFLLLSLSIMLFALTNLCFSAKKLDDIAAVVNDDIVTTSELDHALVVVRTQLTQENRIPEKMLRKQVLDQLINKKLQLQMAKQANIDATKAELDQTITHIAEQNNMSIQDLYDRLQQDGMSKNDYRDELYDQLILHKLQQQEVVGRMNITQQEIKTFKTSQAWQDNSEKEYHLEDILLPLPESPSSEIVNTAKHKAVAIIEQLEKGKKLTNLLNTNSLQHEDLGWRKLNEIPSAFAEQVIRMQKQGVAGPVQTGNGLHILRLINLRSNGGRKVTLTEKQIENLLMQQKLEKAVQIWLAKIRAQAFIQTNDSRNKA